MGPGLVPVAGAAAARGETPLPPPRRTPTLCSPACLDGPPLLLAAPPAGDDFVRLLAEQHHDDHSYRWDSATGDVAPNATQVDSQLDFYWQTDMRGAAGVIDQM